MSAAGNSAPPPRGGPSVAPAKRGLDGLIAQHDVAFAIGLAAILATLLIPLPTMMLDMLLSTSIAIALGTMVVVLSVTGSIELPAFPSLLLLVTLFRLSLNVASTRLILLQGDAGGVIEWFGRTVVGNQLTVGLVVFLILVIIQFVVITKGSERISEVAARFHLDAMPGKQMAIDADLNAGLIGEDEARERRDKIVRESEFYGAMDGASKFIRGDAIAGLVITGVNLIGGFVMGLTRGMTTGESIERYGILAIGDGLITQIPAVIISTSAGFLISKTSTKRSLSQDLIQQTFARSRPLSIASMLLAAMVLVPGLPKVPFVVLALGSGLAARRLRRAERQREVAAEKVAPPTEMEQVTVEEILDVDKICLLVGSRLVKCIDPRRSDSVSHRITPLRRKFAQQYGIVMPLVRLRDNLTLPPDAYEIRLFNHVVARGTLQAERCLAMDPGTVTAQVSGTATTEPVFGLPALWISPDHKEQAELNGYTVVDSESILVTHLSEVLRQHASELLSRDDVQRLVNSLREKQPALVNSVVGELVPIGLLHRVLQNLLREGVPVRDLTQILEALGDHAGRTKDPDLLTELARKSLVRAITERYSDGQARILAINIEPGLEYELCGRSEEPGGKDALGLGPDQALELLRGISGAWRKAMEQGHDKAVLLCDYRIRRQLGGLIARQVPQLAVLAYDEIAPGVRIDTVGTVAIENDSIADEPVETPARAAGRSEARAPVG